MKGCDGIAEHENVMVASALAVIPVLAAPGAGFEIVVFGIFGTVSGAALIEFQTAVPVTKFRFGCGARPIPFHDPCGLFSMGDNQTLQLANVGLVTTSLLVTYEIRPTGT